MHYDIIGDIHGHTKQLTRLLLKMGYINSDRGFYHPENRKVIFVGDYIDRGPAIPETVEIVRTMVDHNNAIALMGNHELNAILFNMKDENGKFLRPHTQKNIDQHAKTQYQFENNSASYDEMISWFKTLPLYFEDKYLRAIHAFWKTAMVDDLTENHLNSDLSLNNSFWADAGNKETNLFHLTDNLLKGKEVPLPDGFSFKDKGGNKRTDTRIKWWDSPIGKTFREWGIAGMGIELPDESIPDKYHNFEKYSENQKPVFMGHYWLTGKPILQKKNVCCLDFSVAKNGYLTGYQFNGERILIRENLVWVR